MVGLFDGQIDIYRVVIRWEVLSTVDNVLIAINLVVLNLDLTLVGRMNIDVIDTTMWNREVSCSLARTSECTDSFASLLCCIERVLEVCSDVVIEEILWVTFTSVHIA